MRRWSLLDEALAAPLAQQRAVECAACDGTGEVKGLLRWRDCDLCRGTGTTREFYCPDHPDAPKSFTVRPVGGRLRQPDGTFPSLRPPVSALRFKCVTCGGTGKSRMWGLTVSCPTCRPGEWKEAGPPAGIDSGRIRRILRVGHPPRSRRRPLPQTADPGRD